MELMETCSTIVMNTKELSGHSIDFILIVTIVTVIAAVEIEAERSSWFASIFKRNGVISGEGLSTDLTLQIMIQIRRDWTLCGLRRRWRLKGRNCLERR